MNLTTWVQTLNEAVCISNNANTLGFGMNLTIFPPAQAIGLMRRVFTNGDQSSIPGRVIPKT